MAFVPLATVTGLKQSSLSCKACAFLWGGAYCDLGCSNGWITNQISQRFGVNAVGLDHKEEHLSIGRSRHPNIEFGLVNLNQPYKGEETFDLVTCFETLEHVGNLENAVQNIITRIAPGGRGLISAPIEHGLRGILKYGVKKFFFGYSVAELQISEREYRRILLSSSRVSKARPPADGYGTHFGFDYRDVDDALSALNTNFTACNRGMSRFYKIHG